MINSMSREHVHQCLAGHARTSNVYSDQGLGLGLGHPGHGQDTDKDMVGTWDMGHTHL